MGRRGHACRNKVGPEPDRLIDPEATRPLANCDGAVTKGACVMLFSGFLFAANLFFIGMNAANIRKRKPGDEEDGDDNFQGFCA
jgi:hypothetical protein